MDARIFIGQLYDTQPDDLLGEFLGFAPQRSKPKKGTLVFAEIFRQSFEFSLQSDFDLYFVKILNELKKTVRSSGYGFVVKKTT
jgi:hypothetical protein